MVDENTMKNPDCTQTFGFIEINQFRMTVFFLSRYLVSLARTGKNIEMTLDYGS